MEEQKKKNPLVIGGVIVLVLAIAGYGAFKYMKKDTNANNVTITPPVVDTTVPPVTTPVNPPVTFVYKNGTYSSTGSYNSPAGVEQIKITLTLKDDVVVDSSVVAMANDRESLKYQNRFISGYKTLVVGKKITDINLTKVSGSSLTPRGWNEAVAQIQSQAKA